MIITDEAAAKLEALLLNKVWRLDWYYFFLEFKDAGEISLNLDDDTVRQFFDDITPKSDILGYTYIYNPRPESDHTEILSIVLACLRDNPAILGNVIRRIFDSNEIPSLQETSGSQLDVLNEKDREHRNNIYEKKIRKKFRKHAGNLVVMAEGDSWFQFPCIRLLGGVIKKDVVKDIVDYLIEENNVAVYSLAAGGDWLTNILRTGEYVEELPKISPDVFLMSGGGNDMVGSRRIATMVRNPNLEGRRELKEDDPATKAFFQLIEKRKSTIADLDEQRFRNGLELISDEFFTFLNVTTAQYFLFFKNLIQLEKYRDMLILTQGYDFAVPTDRHRKGFWRKRVNKSMDTGRWLYGPLMGKGIVEDQDLRDVLYVMITEFNEMLISLVQYAEFENVCHIDCRGVVQNEDDDWFDELHLTSKKYKEVADVYLKCMQDYAQKKEIGKSVPGSAVNLGACWLRLV